MWRIISSVNLVTPLVKHVQREEVTRNVMNVKMDFTLMRMMEISVKNVIQQMVSIFII